MTYLVCYDIGFNRTGDPEAAWRLHAVARVMQNYGIRRQRSVFECRLDRHLYGRMKKELAGVIDTRTDSIMIYPVCADCLRRNAVQGTGLPSTESACAVV
ncbi:MAG TPA: CRISPR-associated endonuclease Cas2 [Deltaproteobacteria bacterium]|nr:CRISPR-associated endonuclease Cas2 [Deltaproteobacteria bacterium]HQI80839.1 CRISPR-associated endonuclease Cas2 [Deltaproteobacteria bacterium]